MKAPLNWLKEYVDIDCTPREYAETLTHTGTKVEGYELLGEDITGVVVGKVLAMERHPDSDHMWICSVDVGADAPLQIVTGAQNVSVGDLVPACLNGAHLPGGKVIKTGKLRGVLSEGMLCSIGELGLTVHDFPYAIEDGIFILQEDCAPGDDIRDVCLLRDTLVEFELTFNRPDCLSYLGLARETAASFGKPLRLHKPEVRPSGDGDDISKYISVKVEDTEKCPRYSAKVVKNVKIAPSPLWLRARLRSAGVRPINNIVDITNYVMLEYGQPMHAFDYGCLSSKKIIVRTAEPGESITTLDGNTHPLSPDMLCIADGEKSVALAGIMGGENSEITEGTETVVFESANFARMNVRLTSREVGLRTESAARFEKGLPPVNTVPALERACELVQLLGCGDIVDGMIDVCTADINSTVIPFDWKRVNELLGTSLTFEQQAELLKPLDLHADGKGNLIVSPYRSDVVTTADIAEEVARLYGYNNIESTLFKSEAKEGKYTEEQKFVRTILSTMTAYGFTEIYTYSFISPKWYDSVLIPADSPLRDCIKLLNPLGDDTSVMRTTALPSMLDAISRNRNMRAQECRLFENACVYAKSESDMSDERKVITAAFYGGSNDFYDMKGYIEGLLAEINLRDYTVVAETGNPSYHPGRCAAIYSGKRFIGVFGQVHPTAAANFGLEIPVYAAEISVKAAFTAHSPDRDYTPLAVYPAIERDVALIMDDAQTAEEVYSAARQYGGKTLESIEAFDLYKGKGVPDGKKSVAFRITLRRSDRTLSDDEADAMVSKLLKKLGETKGITLRS